MKKYFAMLDIDDKILSRIKGISYKEDCPLSVDELCYIAVLHYDFCGQVQEGEIIVNRRIGADVCGIFKELYEIRYPIEKIRLIDEYGADDERSMADNNSSAFNYRVIDGTDILSNHAKGFAIDVNPLYNPYIRVLNQVCKISPEGGAAFADRTVNHPYYIRKDDDCYRIFASHGFSWGGEWEHAKDYQHFEKVMN